jgi:hypothetical protein
MSNPTLDKEASLEEELLTPTWPPDGRTGEWWMLWQEDGPNTDLDALLREAMRHFQQKYHLLPNRALVHPTWGSRLVNGEGKFVDLPQFPGLRIRTARTMLMGHVGLSYEDGHHETH